MNSHKIHALPALMIAAAVMLPPSVFGQTAAEQRSPGQTTGSAKIAWDVPKTGNVDVIVQYSSRPDATSHQKVWRAGGTLNRELGSVNGGAYTVPRSALETLAADPDVVHIAPDHTLHGMLEFANPAVNANIAFAHGYDGTGIGVAVLDSGIDPHPDLNSQSGSASRILYSE